MKNFQSLAEITSAIDAGKLSVYDLTLYYLKNIEEKNGRLNAFLSVFKEEVVEKAKEVDRKIEAGKAGKLAGLVVGIKDVFCYKDHPLTCASQILEGFESQFTATCIQRLIDEDAIIIGRQNCDEFAMGSTNENSAFGVARNPVDEQTVPGGSSGGSSSAVAADFCQVSIGSDTGGSVRQPAAFCGVVGFKPTYGRISRYGLASYASSFDTVGIISKCVDDARLILEVMSGPDQYDSTASKSSFSLTKELSQKKFKIGLLSQSYAEGVQAEIQTATKSVVDKLEEEGHEVEIIEFDLHDYLLSTYYVLTAAEASSNLSRYDGVRYGFREEAHDIHEMYKNTRTSGFGKEVKRRIMTGTFVLSARYHDAYYTQAQKVRRLVQEETNKILEEVDFILSPTTPSTAMNVGEVSNDPIKMYLEDLFTVQANVAGIPAISIPYGKDRKGLPIGIQLMSKAFNEENLLAILAQIATLTD